MTHQTRYRYEKRIKELEESLRCAETERYDYKAVALTIFDEAIKAAEGGNCLGAAWILSQFKRVMK